MSSDAKSLDKPTKRRLASTREAGPRRQKAEITRAKILEVALKAFAQHGFDGTSTREIAANAGVTEAMISYYFVGKEALWQAAVDFLFARMRRELGSRKEVGVTLSSPDGFRDVLKAYVRYCGRHPDHARLMVQESIRGGPRLEWMVQKYIAPGHDAGLSHVVKLFGLSNVPPILISTLIVAACQMPYLLAAEIKASTNIDTSAESFIDAHIEAVLALFGGTRLT